MRDLVRERWIYLLGAGAAVVCLGYFTASLALYWRQEPAPCYPFGCEPDTPTGRPTIQSPCEFDQHLDKSEHRFGITKLRRQIGQLAHGHVLEVAIGTGRNFEFYDWTVVTDSLLTPEERAKTMAKKRKKGSGWLPAWAGGSGSGSGSGGDGDGDGGKDGEKDGNAILSFTGVDVSPGMLDIALRRVRQLVPHMHELIPKSPSFAVLVAQQKRQNAGSNDRVSGAHSLSFLSDRIRLLQSDVQTGLPAPPTLSPLSSPSPQPPPPQKYDTILQSFGLCSVRDPVALIVDMASLLRPETGRIVLLEHGRSIWDAVNGLLDRGARGHHERFGCWWNRDIEVIVHEAARRVPGLQILRFERPGWVTGGTHIVVEMRLNSGGSSSSSSSSSSTDDGDHHNGEERWNNEKTTLSWGQILPSILSTKRGDDK